MEINTIYEEALLAQAAYASLSAGMAGTTLTNALKGLESKGVTQTQAEYFASKYTVVYQENKDSGFSATLFKNIDDQTYHLAMRGTNSSGDIDDNYHNVVDGISYLQVADSINFYLQLIAPEGASVAQFKFEEVITSLDATPPEGAIFAGFEYGEDDDDGDGVEDIIGNIYLTFIPDADGTGLGSIAPSQKLNVTGHSLGGHLASAFTLLFPSVTLQTTTFNSAGIIGDNVDSFEEFVNVITHGIQSTLPGFSFTPEKIENLSTPVMNYSTESDLISDIPLLGNTHLGGEPVNVFIDSKDELFDIEWLDSHAIDMIVDSLAVMNLLYTLDNLIDLTTANELLPLGSDDEDTELEGMMNHLARLFNQGEVAVTNSEHDDVYKTINQITENLDGKTYKISEITDDIATQALAEDKTALYALLNLQPFVVEGTTSDINNALYQPHSDNDVLDIENYSEFYTPLRNAA